MNNLVILLTILVGSIHAISPWSQNIHSENACLLTDFGRVSEITQTCKNITIGDMLVPPGETLVLQLQDGAILTFSGNVTFGFKNWKGPLLRINGSAVVVQGEEGHVLNGQGELYWDSVGSFGSVKPKFTEFYASNHSIYRNIHIYHAPMHGVGIYESDNAIFTNFLIDNADGAENVAPLNKAGHNTDGFGVHHSTNIVIRDSVVYNQDDCIVINSGSNIHVQKMLCHGSHGLSISAGFSNTSTQLNTVTNVVIEDSTIIDSANGIHIKNHLNAGVGLVSNITYRNIVMIGCYSYGITIEQNYTNTLVPGQGAIPKNNIPFKGLKFSNIKGTVTNTSVPYNIVCAKDGCLDWEWEDIDVYGIQQSACVNFHPDGISCIDYEL